MRRTALRMMDAAFEEVAHLGKQISSEPVSPREGRKGSYKGSFSSAVKGTAHRLLGTSAKKLPAAQPRAYPVGSACTTRRAISPLPCHDQPRPATAFHGLPVTFHGLPMTVPSPARA